MAIENNQELQPPYRPAKPVPFELIQHSGIFFEEKLCSHPLPQTTSGYPANTVYTYRYTSP